MPERERAFKTRTKNPLGKKCFSIRFLGVLADPPPDLTQRKPRKEYTVYDLEKGDASPKTYYKGMLLYATVSRQNYIISIRDSIYCFSKINKKYIVQHKIKYFFFIVSDITLFHEYCIVYQFFSKNFMNVDTPKVRFSRMV